MSLAVAQPLPLNQYRPRSPRKTPLYEIVLDHHERLAAVYDETYAPRYGAWRPHVADTLLAYLDCGDFSNGFLRVACTTKGCRHEILVPFSCKKAICPSCGQRRSLDFAEFVNAEALDPVPFRHVVVTVPRMLRAAFLRDRKLLGELSRCAWDTLRKALSLAVGDARAVPGAVISRATAGDLANGHPHLHILVSCGAWAHGGKGDFLAWPPHLTGECLEQLFRRKLLALLVRRERLAQSTADRLIQWSPSGFSVWVGDPIGPEEVESRLRLARYLTKPPIALDRMRYDPETCLVHLTSTSQGRSRTVPALDFLADLVCHIPDRGEHGVSYVGRCSNRSRGERRKAAQRQADVDQLPPPPPPLARKAFRTAWAKLLKKVWRVEVERCPRCGGTVRVLAAILDLPSIRRIMEHLKIPRPRPPNPHDCPPPPGAQLLLFPGRAPVASPRPEVDDRDPRLSDDWPVDAPFTDD